jgi:hypothetical protein
MFDERDESAGTGAESNDIGTPDECEMFASGGKDGEADVDRQARVHWYDRMPAAEHGFTTDDPRCVRTQVVLRAEPVKLHGV